jgi:hypothetical protein
MKKVFMFVVALSIALFATGVFAQTSTTGSVEGTVTDPNGAAVKGATVTVTSPNLISPQSATTDDNGHFQVLNLPPGQYKVVIDSDSYRAGHGRSGCRCSAEHIRLKRFNRAVLELPDSANGAESLHDCADSDAFRLARCNRPRPRSFSSWFLRP